MVSVGFSWLADCKKSQLSHIRFCMNVLFYCFLEKIFLSSHSLECNNCVHTSLPPPPPTYPPSRSCCHSRPSSLNEVAPYDVLVPFLSFYNSIEFVLKDPCIYIPLLCVLAPTQVLYKDVFVSLDWVRFPAPTFCIIPLHCVNKAGSSFIKNRNWSIFGVCVCVCVCVRSGRGREGTTVNSWRSYDWQIASLDVYVARLFQ